MAEKTVLGTEEKTMDQVREPGKFSVILLNDNYTTMDFVVRVIKQVFHKSVVEATKIMMDVHRKGKGTVGIYSYDIARTKISKVRELARQEEFPLECGLEKI